jgi:hypothetical protein
MKLDFCVSDNYTQVFRVHFWVEFQQRRRRLLLLWDIWLLLLLSV